jgi:hypothetical protein
MPKPYQRRSSPPKPAAPCDLRLFYQGAVIAIEPHSLAGRAWMEATVADCEGLPAVRLPLDMVDEVLRLAVKAKLKLDVPWDSD